MGRIRKIFLVGLLLFSISQPLSAKESNLLVVKDDTAVELEENQPFESKGVSYVPVRALGEICDTNVLWDASTQRVTLEGKNHIIVIDTKNKKCYPKGNANNLGNGSFLDVKRRGNTIYIPLRSFTELLGYQVTYIPKGPIAWIQTKESGLTEEMIYEKYKTQIPVSRQTLYLTFDDGPNAYTEDILDLLEEYDMQATFFVLKKGMTAYPDTIRRMVADNHTVGIHGVTHDKNQFYNGNNGPYNEVKEAQQTLKAITGIETKVVRVPYGSVPYLTNAQKSVLDKAGYELWDWHVDSRDWANKNGQVTYQQVVSQLEGVGVDDPVLLFHDSAYTLETIEKLLVWMTDHGWTSKRLEQGENGLNFKERNLYSN